MNHPLRCRCGAIEGYVASPRSAGRAVCYCRDCQSFARFLGDAQHILDSAGGTAIVATQPRHVHLTRGTQHLRCMRLSDKGLLRWYAGCCRTPIGNTPPDPKLSYVGLVHSCLPGTGAEIDRAFGPPRIALNTGSATLPVSPTRVASFFGILKIIRNVLSARLSGAYKDNPFFQPGSATPVAPVQTLTLAQRRALRDDA